MATRSELEAALKAGYRVNVNGQSCKHVKELPPELAPTEDNPDPTPLVGVIMYDPSGNLTREGMEFVIRTGGTVLHNGEFIKDVDLLPTSADLARGDATRTKTERDRLLGQQAAIQAELAKLETPAPPPALAQPVHQSQPKASDLPRQTVDVGEVRKQVSEQERQHHRGK